jgi:branched-chain amino acid transport system substrate-binding protein
MTRHLTHVALALLTSLVTWSCAAQAADDVRIGAPLALTGSLADEGKKQALAYDLWLTRVNAAGGIAWMGRRRK